MATSLGICLVAGVAMAMADIYLRLPLHMPGWRGIVGMALLILARRLSGRAWGASAAAIVAACVSLYAGETLRHGPFVYLLPGFVIDTLCLVLPAWQNRAVYLAVAAGLANSSKFAVALVGLAAMGPAGGHGVLMPLASHFGFGLCGGLIAAALFLPIARRRDRTA